MMIPNFTPSFRILEGIRWTEVVKSCFWGETSKFVWWRSIDGGRTIYPGIRLWDVQLRSTPHWNHRRLLRTGSMYKPQTSPNIPKPPKLRPYYENNENLWQVLQQSKEIQTKRPDTTRLPRLSCRCEEPWLLWIGADAAIVDFGADVLRQLLRATDSHVQAATRMTIAAIAKDC